MPYVLGGILLVLEVLCIVHAVRNGRVFPWIYILLFLPAIGTAAYIVAELIPDLMGSRGAGRLRRGIARAADPTGDLRAAKRKSELVGSVEAKVRLAEEHLRRGESAQAVEVYQEALTGLHKDDPMLLFGLARAHLAAGDGAGAQDALDTLKGAHPEFSSPDAHLVYAQALELQGRNAEATAEYAALCEYFPGEEARCRYGQLLARTGSAAQARRIFEEVLWRAEDAPAHYRRMQKQWHQMARRELASLNGPAA